VAHSELFTVDGRRIRPSGHPVRPAETLKQKDEGGGRRKGGVGAQEVKLHVDINKREFPLDYEIRELGAHS